MSTGAPLLICLPQGLSISGVTMWAVRLAGALVERGRAAGLIVHGVPPGQASLEIEVDPRVRVWRFEGPSLDRSEGAFVPGYREAVEQLGGGGPVVVSPNLHGDCYGIAAALALVMPDRVRIVGWQHSDIEYDTRLLMHYEPAIARFVGVSAAITDSLRHRLGGRSGDVIGLPYGVATGAGRRERAPGPLRLIYAGRLEHQQKRVMALVHMSDALVSRGIEHRLSIAGDGPARGELECAAAERSGRIALLGAVPPEATSRLLRGHDAFVLPSRYEGLSVSMLEAMSAGCVPVLARTRSGAEQAIEHGYNGALADVGPEAGDAAAGLAMADAIAAALRRDLAGMSAAAQRTVAERFSLDRHVEGAIAVIDAAAASPARAWPATKACAFTSTSAEGTGSVPREGAGLLRELMVRLAGRRIIVHGTGQHTLQLGAVLAESPASIVAFADDDPARHGGKLWNWPIIAPGSARESGATDVVISSWMHQEAIYGRREMYERQGLRIHLVYPAS
jgi:glycosyltransferase involved in cell wall biosynthesis